jgi:uncharacterized membrane protein
LSVKVWPVLRGLGVALLAVAWAIAAHLATASGEPSNWGAAVALAPLVVAAAVALVRWSHRKLALLVALGLAALLWLAWPMLTARMTLLYLVQHVGIYALLAAFFLRSLGGPGESLITQVARRVHGGVLSLNQQRYTRKVTWAWGIFFVAMVVVSFGLYAWAPIEIWSTFANLLGGPLIGAMFLGELIVRRLSLPNEARATLAESVRAWRAHNAESDR